MNKTIKEIINSNYLKTKDKLEQLEQLESDITFAKNVVSGVYKYCPKCDDYYLSKSFLTEHETKLARICIYEDPINSGGNDYVDGYADITYSICPKGHKREIDRKERRK